MFSEVQKFRQHLLWALLFLPLLAVTVTAVMVMRSLRAGDAPAGLLGLVGGVGAIVALVTSFFIAGALETEVGQEGLSVRFRPFRGRVISFEEIASADAREYSPIREYGGWGYRISPAGRAYNVSGRHGVQLVLKDGSRILIGSQRADELAAAVQARIEPS